MPKAAEARPSNPHVAREIARLIVTGTWREGWTLPREIELAAQFDVSRTSIRESLSVLKAKGLIAARQKAGTHVRERLNWNMMDAELLEWTWADQPREEFARQLMQMRRIVEPEASAISAERATDSDLARIERAYREMEAAGMDRSAYAEPDLRFHRAILMATGNDFLVAFAATMEAGIRVSLELSMHNPAAPRRGLPYHRAVLDEIWARNPAGARAAMHRLIDLTERNIAAALPRRRSSEALTQAGADRPPK
ncbi:FadR family transcriptional regulator [Bradyrhizobium genosp. L]|uniref:FadR/GntR family transcriptional regulator n=1 Tax=Bradyrhizobium genosp. L TaxID=83637 RepID=UPI0018A2AC92|nr:FadR/GntR family transcriptional regulator [Bradyrhizobium genosp. L]QPF86568.1 FadR family transcriptional regulator [Bradyrhizobium genosp. L]